MARLKNGVFGGFSGKIGNVIGSSWRGIDYIKSLPVKMHDPKTKGQVKQRSRFSVTMDFLRTITPFLRIGFQSHADGRMTAFNAAMSYNMKFAVKGENKDVEVDYPNVLVSRGTLGTAADIHAEIVEGKLQVSWEEPLLKNTRYDDMAMMVAYNPVKHQSVYDINAGKRANGKTSLPLPSSWNGDAIETYLAFKTTDGVVVSDSIYTGRHLVH